MADLDFVVGNMEFRDADAAWRLSEEWLQNAARMEADAAILRAKAEEVQAALFAQTGEREREEEAR